MQSRRNTQYDVRPLLIVGFILANVRHEHFWVVFQRDRFHRVEATHGFLLAVHRQLVQLLSGELVQPELLEEEILVDHLRGVESATRLRVPQRGLPFESSTVVRLVVFPLRPIRFRSATVTASATYSSAQLVGASSIRSAGMGRKRGRGMPPELDSLLLAPMMIRKHARVARSLTGVPGRAGRPHTARETRGRGATSRAVSRSGGHAPDLDRLTG